MSSGKLFLQTFTRVSRLTVVAAISPRHFPLGRSANTSDTSGSRPWPARLVPTRTFLSERKTQPGGRESKLSNKRVSDYISL